MAKGPASETAGPGDAPAFAEAYRALRDDGSIQFEFKDAERQEPPGWLVSLFEFIERNAEVLKVLFWILLGIAALFVLYLLARRFWGAGWPWRREQAGPEEPDWRPSEAPARQLLAEADALAERGLYSEAAHLLLFRSIEDIERRRPDLLRPALTSREISSLEAIPSRPRGAFATIAMTVERSLFAARALAQEDWRRCREAYEDFAFAQGWRR